jgi:hypothetical protein
MLLVFGCSQVNTLNFKRHNFNVTPTQVIWFQIAGLSDEHLAFLKYSLPSSNSKIIFEEMTCSGRIWNYNLYNLRPDAHQGFLSQILGKKNVTGTCEDFLNEPMWNYFDQIGFQTIILENGASEKASLDQRKSCQETNPTFLSKVALWRMYEGLESDEKFHYSENQEILKGRVYFDKSCRKNNCYASLINNSQSLYEKLTKKNANYFFLIRDFSFMDALNRKEISIAKDKLIELERTINLFIEKARNNPEIMVLVTSSAPLSLEFPNAGKNWSEFDKKGTQILFHQSSLISPVYSFGARSENFCGLFEEAQIFERALTSPQKSGVSLPIFN